MIGNTCGTASAKISEPRTQLAKKAASLSWRSISSSYPWRPCTRNVSQSFKEFMRRDHCALTWKLSSGAELLDCTPRVGMYGVLKPKVWLSVSGCEVRTTPAANGMASHL